MKPFKHKTKMVERNFLQTQNDREITHSVSHIDHVGIMGVVDLIRDLLTLHIVTLQWQKLKYDTNTKQSFSGVIYKLLQHFHSFVL